MKKFLALFSLLFASMVAAQSTATLTGAVTDPAGQVWFGAKITFNLFNPGGGTPTDKYTGHPVKLQQIVTLDGSGNFSGAIERNDAIVPDGTTWTIQACAQTAAQCQTLTTQRIAASTYNAGAFVSANIVSPSFAAVAGSYGYNTSEAITGPSYATFFNVTSQCQETYNYQTSTWACGSGGVTQIVPGTNVAVSPAGGTGVVTVSASGGVPYNPSTTTYISIGSSINGDDNHVLGQTITVTSGSCTTSSCSITNSGTNGLSVGDWVYVGALTGWPAIPAPYGAYSTGYGTFQITAATATSFSFNSTLGVATITGGTAYGASSWVIYGASKLPFLNGHGSPKLLMGTGSYCSDLDSNYTTMLHPLSPAVTGNPAYLIILDCHNDYNPSTATIASIEATYTDLASKWHADGGTVVVSDMTGEQMNGSMPGGNNALFAVRQWMWQTLAVKNNSSIANGQYADIMIDALAVLSDATSPLFNSNLGQLAPGGAQIYAELLNNALATQGTPLHHQDVTRGWGYTDGLTSSSGYYFKGNSYNALYATDPSSTSLIFNVDNVQHRVTNQQLLITGNNGYHAFSILASGNGNNNSQYVSGVYLNGLSGGWPGTNSSRIMQSFGQSDTGNYNQVNEEFDYVGSASTSNEWQKSFSGATNSFMRAYATGEFDLPTVAPAGTSPNCLQIAGAGSATPGQITATGSGCGIPSGEEHLLNQPLCTLAASTDSGCTGSFTLPTAYSSANYTVNTQVTAASGAWIYMTIVSKTTTTVNYAATCTFNCATIGTPTFDATTYFVGP